MFATEKLHAFKLQIYEKAIVLRCEENLVAVQSQYERKCPDLKFCQFETSRVRNRTSYETYVACGYGQTIVLGQDSVSFRRSSGPDTRHVMQAGGMSSGRCTF